MSGFDPFGPKSDLSREEGEALKDALVSPAELKVRVPDAPDVDEFIPGTSLKRYPRNRPCPPLDVYVEEQVEAVRRLMSKGLKNPVYLGDDRIVRAEAYARWRWQGFKDGEIASL